MRLDLKDDADKNLVSSFIVRFPDDKADELLVDFVRHEMTMRLNEQAAKGFHGWHTPGCTDKDLISRLKSNLDKGDYIDVINLAAMLEVRKRLFKSA